MNPTVWKTVLLIMIVVCIYCIYKWYVYTSEEKFVSITLNDVQLPANPSSQLIDALKSYDCYFNPETVSSLRYGSALSQELIQRNQIKNQDKMSLMYKQIDDSLDQMNYNLLTQIQKNYYDAHILNAERENNKLKLSQLPLRNL